MPVDTSLSTAHQVGKYGKQEYRENTLRRQAPFSSHWFHLEGGMQIEISELLATARFIAEALGNGRNMKLVRTRHYKDK